MKRERNILMTDHSPTSKNKKLHELAKEFPDKTYRELEKYRYADQLELIKEEIQKREREGLEPIRREIRWRERYNKEHKLRQEAEGELTIIKGIGNTSPEMRHAKEKIKELQSNLDRIKKENNDLYNRIAELKEAELAAHTLQKARESGL